MLLIKKCNDGMMWYAGLVGQTVYHEPNVGWEDDGVYKSRDLGGCLNIVRMGDAEVVDELGRLQPLLGYRGWEPSIGYCEVNLCDVILHLIGSTRNVVLTREDAEALAKHYNLL